MQEGFFAGDELWQWADARMSGSSKNKFITSILGKSRKRGINITFTAQRFQNIDVRLRSICDFLALPQLNAAETLCRVTVYSMPEMQLQQIFKFRTARIFPLYDTKEEVRQLSYEPEEKVKLIKKKVENAVDEAVGLPKIRRKPKEKSVDYEK